MGKSTEISSKDHFWSKVDIGEEDECWEWLDFADRYGQCRIEGQKLSSHRAAWMLTHGEIPEGLCVCHHCDNPLCCNPSHLFLGTQADNIADKVRKGRQARGTQQWNAHLSEADVLEIRQMRKETDLSLREIGNIFEVSPQAIHYIVHRKSWAWL